VERSIADALISRPKKVSKKKPKRRHVMGMTPKEVLDFAKKNGAEMVDLKFIDFPGVWQHFTVPISELEEDIFENGLGFDGSSIRGWQPIHASDMLIIPDAKTAVMDPIMAHPTLSLICNIVDAVTREKYSRDPRNIAQKANLRHWDWRYCLLWSRGGILYLRRRALRPNPQ
jgi:glutamine synthetase